ncbi:hypothetical protein HPB49_015104 [Dermacentor silvarum]|uniref:Uncharacterized protein n=1 Tax=Dermacentor silvarum TaxID=543639 RepID=A0ACB8E0Y3_DERSI|nr:hypothetical protein HPB49_015104 [Dermacentor silvarum]
MLLVARVEGTKYDVSYTLSYLSIHDVHPDNRDPVLKPWNKADERVCGSRIGRPRRRFPWAEWDPLVEMGVKETVPASEEPITGGVEAGVSMFHNADKCGSEASPEYSVGVLGVNPPIHPRDTLPYLLTLLNSINAECNSDVDGFARLHARKLLRLGNVQDVDVAVLTWFNDVRKFDHREASSSLLRIDILGSVSIPDVLDSLVTRPEGAIDDVSYVSINLAIHHVRSDNRDLVLKLRNKANERASDSCVGRQRKLFPRAECYLLVVGVKDNVCHCNTMQAPCTVQGASRQTLVVSRGTGRLLMIHREVIVSVINRVVVLCGETGSGKITEAGQFIFEDYIRGGQGSRCNMLVTQRRRIAAISMAKQAALEWHEELSDTVGFHVRHTKQLLTSRGGKLFCTAGILLRPLLQNVELQGVSHVIVDKVHERDVCTDFLLVLLREVLSIHRTFKCGSDAVRIVPDVFMHIVDMKPSEAIFCFLPGWNEINKRASRALRGSSSEV